MKKILLAAIILLCVNCAGCLEGGSNLIITDDGKVFVRNKLIGVPLIAEHIESFRQSFANNPNAEISPVVEKNMSGYEVRANYPSVEKFAADCSSIYAAHEGKCKGIQQHKGFFFDAYNFDLISAGKKNFSPSEAAAVQSMLSQVSFDLTLELPYAAENHNADKFDAAQKVLTWNLAPVLTGGGEKHMHAQFRIWHKDKIALTAAIELLLLAAMIFFFWKARSADFETVGKDLIFKRNVFAGLSVALALVAAHMIFAPVTFTDAEIISPIFAS